MPLLEVQNLVKIFGGLKANDDISFQVEKGELIGLIGPNGAGKTTIVNLITGMLPVTSGAILLGGLEITHSPAHEISRAGFARTFQNIRLLAEESVLDNVMVGFHRHETSSTLALSHS